MRIGNSTSLLMNKVLNGHEDGKLADTGGLPSSRGWDQRCERWTLNINTGLVLKYSALENGHRFRVCICYATKARWEVSHTWFDHLGCPNPKSAAEYIHDLKALPSVFERVVPFTFLSLHPSISQSGAQCGCSKLSRAVKLLFDLFNSPLGNRGPADPGSHAGCDTGSLASHLIRSQAGICPTSFKSLGDVIEKRFALRTVAFERPTQHRYDDPGVKVYWKA